MFPNTVDPIEAKNKAAAEKVPVAEGTLVYTAVPSILLYGKCSVWTIPLHRRGCPAPNEPCSCAHSVTMFLPYPYLKRQKTTKDQNDEFSVGFEKTVFLWFYYKLLVVKTYRFLCVIKLGPL